MSHEWKFEIKNGMDLRSIVLPNEKEAFSVDPFDFDSKEYFR